MNNLTTDESNAALKKIRAKYDQLIKEFKKSPVLRENFEDRYLNAVKTRQNMSAFILGEIEAIEELYKREAEKAAQKSAAAESAGAKPSLSDAALQKTKAVQMYEENLQRIRKYPAVEMGEAAVEDISRLLGAVRVLINDYYPALNLIFRNMDHTVYIEKLSSFYNRLMNEYDYKGDVPMARRYKDLVSMRNTDRGKIDYEYRYVLQETAFLLNDIHDCLETLLRDAASTIPAKKIVIVPSKFGVSGKCKSIFNGKRYSNAFSIVRDYTEEVLKDFRLHSIRRN